MKEQIEKQAIEEMAKDLCIPIMRFLPWVNCEMCESNGTDIELCLFHKYATILTKAGYRKQSEGEKSKGCEYCKGRAYTKKPLTVITKYGRRIELVFEFCPNCGRKMKGGAE